MARSCRISPKHFLTTSARSLLSIGRSRGGGGFLVESGRLCAGAGTPFDEFRERARVERIMSRTDSLPSMFNHGALFTRETGPDVSERSVAPFWSFMERRTQFCLSRMGQPSPTPYPTHHLPFSPGLAMRYPCWLSKKSLSRSRRMSEAQLLA